MRDPSHDLVSFKAIKKKLKNVAKKSLPIAAVRGLQNTIRPLRRAKLRLESTFNPAQFLADPFPRPEIHYVRPQDINLWGRRPKAVFSPWRDRGRVLDGDWDLAINDLRIDQTSLYTSYQLRLKTGSEWQDTPYYRKIAEQIEGGEVLWNCRNKKELDLKCKAWDQVFESIRDDGYMPNQGDDEISVNIDRHGRLLLNDGYHRLVFAKLLAVPSIPVMVLVRHRRWHDFKRELYEFIRSGRHSAAGMAYAPLLHPDLTSVPSQHGHDRFEIIRQHVHGKKILDIGAHLGYFSHRFEELGFECTAVESHPDICYFLRRLHAAQERKFRIVEDSVFSFVERERPVVDTVLALSILHHFLKDESSYKQLVILLNTLEAKEMIFEPHCHRERQMNGAYRNFDSEAFVGFILENSRFTQAENIGTAKDGRKIFRLF